MSTYRQQLKTVLAIEAVIIVAIGAWAYFFWNAMCPGGWASCVGTSETAPYWFIILSIIRPLVATPTIILAFIAGDAFGPFLGSIYAAFGLCLSTLVIYLPAKYFGKIFVKPFLASNLPATWKLIRTQDYKVVFITRLIPIFPFDIMSLLFGALDFRFKSVMTATLIGSLVECFMFASMPSDISASVLKSTLKTLIIFTTVAVVPLIVYEIISRKNGASLWNRLKNVYRELLFEIRTNNEIVHQQTYDNRSIPVILLYGFFSSRRALTVLERILVSRGFQVMSFNLGGLFGVFFTRGITETARYIDTKIRRQIHRHDFKKVHIIGHSKGGLVALWWLLKLGGSKYCDLVITLATPFRGSIFTYLALITPLGLLWQDVWQMRPGSKFLKILHSAKIPSNARIYCLYSHKDKVAAGEAAIYRNTQDPQRIHPIPMHHIGHFEFLYRRDVGDVLAKILRESEEHPLETSEVPPEDADKIASQA